MKESNINPGYLEAQKVALGELLRKNREAKGYTLEQLADKAELRPETIDKMERGIWNCKISFYQILGVYLDMELTLVPRK